MSAKVEVRLNIRHEEDGDVDGDEQSSLMDRMSVEQIATHITHVVLSLGEKVKECEARGQVAWRLPAENENTPEEQHCTCPSRGLQSSSRTSESPLWRTRDDSAAEQRAASSEKTEIIPLHMKSSTKNNHNNNNNSVITSSKAREIQNQNRLEDRLQGSGLCLCRHIHHCEFGVSERAFGRLINHVRGLFSEEQLLLHVPAPVVVCGDLHGQLHDLVRILEKLGLPGPLPGPLPEPYCSASAAASEAAAGGKEWWRTPIRRLIGDPQEEQRYLFLGDYVDRGTQSVEVLALLFALKTLYPDRVLLLRGNHESPRINKMFNFKAETIAKFSSETYGRMANAFYMMPVAALIERSDAAGVKLEDRERRAFAAHGGITSTLGHLKSLDDKLFVRPFDVASKGPICDIIWSDPAPLFEGRWRPSPREISGEFGRTALEDFCRRHSVKYVLRAHQYKEKGYEVSFDGHLVSIFSASNYMGEHDNPGAVCYVHSDIRSSIVRIKPLSIGLSIEKLAKDVIAKLEL